MSLFSIFKARADQPPAPATKDHISRGQRITTDFYRTTALPSGSIVVNLRMYAFKQPSGLFALRHQRVCNAPELVSSSILPDRFSLRAIPAKDKNLTFEQVVARLEGFKTAREQSGQTECDFLRPEKEIPLAHAQKLTFA